MRQGNGLKYHEIFLPTLRYGMSPILRIESQVEFKILKIKMLLEYSELYLNVSGHM